MFSRPEAFEFHFSRAFRKEWVGVNRAVRLARKFVRVSNLSCRTVPHPAASEPRRIDSGLHTLPPTASPSTSQAQSGLYQEGDQDIYYEAAQSVILRFDAFKF